MSADERQLRIDELQQHKAYINCWLGFLDDYREADNTRRGLMHDATAVLLEIDRELLQLDAPLSADERVSELSRVAVGDGAAARP